MDSPLGGLPGCCPAAADEAASGSGQIGSNVAGSRPFRSALNTAARIWSMLPGVPADLRNRAMALIRLSAEIISAVGNSRPEMAPLPDVSCQASTRASPRAFSDRRRAASGSTIRIIRRSSARSWPVVIFSAARQSAIAIVCAVNSSNWASSVANTAALARSSRPSRSAWSIRGSLTRSRARHSSASADLLVRMSAAASSALTCSLARDDCGTAATRRRRASISATAASSIASCLDASRRVAHRKPMSSSSDSLPRPAS